MASDTRNPTSDEAVSGSWSGSAGTRYQAVDDYPDPSGADFLTHGTTAGDLTFGFPTLSLPSGSTGISVRVLYYDQKTASQSCNIGARLKIGGSYFNSGTHNPANGVWTQRTDDFGATNPATGLPWTVDDVNGLQAFGWHSTDASPTIRVSSIQLQVLYTPPVTCDLAANESPDVLAGDAQVEWRADLAAAETPDTLAGSADVSEGAITADLAAVESPDLAVLDAKVEWLAALATSEAPDVLLAGAAVEWPPVTCDLAAVENSDSFHGQVRGPARQKSGLPPAVSVAIGEHNS